MYRPDFPGSDRSDPGNFHDKHTERRASPARDVARREAGPRAGAELSGERPGVVPGCGKNHAEAQRRREEKVFAREAAKGAKEKGGDGPRLRAFKAGGP